MAGLPSFGARLRACRRPSSYHGAYERLLTIGPDGITRASGDTAPPSVAAIARGRDRHAAPV
jgi:hypothetical protein